MRISKKMLTELNRQINAELYSAYLYLAMSAYFESQNLSGFAHWMFIQAHEEFDHAMKFYRYVFDRGGVVNLSSIEKPPHKWISPLKAFTDAYKHEQKVSKMINKLADLTDEENDKATTSFLQWFIDEQVEEESSADEIVKSLALIGNNISGLLMLDAKLGQRKSE